MNRPANTVYPLVAVDDTGRLTAEMADGTVYSNLYAVRAFPVQAPDAGVSLMGDDGHERVWLDNLNDLPDTTRAAVAQALAQREFMPLIKKLVAVSAFATPSTWTVETDRGTTDLVLKGEEDIRRLSANVLLVLDSHGVQFLIRDPSQMDKHSRKLLDRFL
jgi:Domain of unknown function (DUF1854)